jgi:DNA-binding CsgD family transcriptional regulator
MKAKLKDYLQQLSKEDIIDLFLQTVKEEKATIPLSIFRVEPLSALELVVRYLKETGKKNKEIAELIGRSQQVIWTTNRNAMRKYPHILPVSDSPNDVPIDCVCKAKLSALESIVVYLKEDKSLRYSEIGEVLHRDPRTIWTTYKRAKKKDEEGQITQTV